MSQSPKTNEKRCSHCGEWRQCVRIPKSGRDVCPVCYAKGKR